MQAGIVTDDNIAQILRGISQKRRHGVLEVHTGERILEISFYQGKIVDLRDKGQSLLIRVAKKLSERETIMPHPWIDTLESFEQFSAQLKKAGEEVSPELISMAREQQALEMLYSMELVTGSFYHFRVEMVQTPADGDLQLSVGQLLLDMVALKENHQNFAKRLNESAVINRGTPEERGYSCEEQDLIWLVDGQMSVAELRNRSLLSRLTFEETLLLLVESGILEEENSAGISAQPVFDLSSLDAAIDESVQEVLKVSAVAKEMTPQAQVLPITPKISDDTFHKLSRQLLQGSWAPEAVAAIFVAASVVIPLLLW